MRLVLTLLLAALLPAGLLAGKGKGNNPKPNNAAQIQALEQQKKQLQAEEKAHLQRIEAQLRAELNRLHQQKGHLDRSLREKLEAEERQALKRIQERFAYLREHQKPNQVWGQLDHALQVSRDVLRLLQRASSDYGGHKGAAIQSLSVAVGSLEHRLKVHRWTAAEKQKTVRELQRAETDLQTALTYAINKYGTGTPRGARESQLKSNQQLSEGVTTLDNVRHLVLHAEWEESADARWAERITKEEQAQRHKVKESYGARLKNMDKEVAQHIQQHTRELEQHKQQAIAQVKAQVKAAIQQIDNQIRQLRR